MKYLLCRTTTQCSAVRAIHLFSQTVIALMWSAPVRSDQLDVAAGGTTRCSFNHRDFKRPFSNCV